jgi:hypothetical protein
VRHAEALAKVANLFTKGRKGYLCQTKFGDFNFCFGKTELAQPDKKNC